MVRRVVKHCARRLAPRFLLAGALAAAGLIARAPPAAAHPEISPHLVNRYLSAVVLGDNVQVSLALLFGPIPASSHRREMDTDGDGRLSEGEIDAEKQRWVKDAAQFFTLTIDGIAVPLAVDGLVDVGDEPTAGAAPVVIELGASTPLSGGEHQLRLEPGRDPPRPGETEISLDLSPGWTLLSSHRGRGGPSPESSAGRAEKLWRYQFDGPRLAAVEDRSVTFVIRRSDATAGTAATEGSTAGWAVLAMALVVGGAGVGIAALARRRRPRNSGPNAQTQP